MSFLGDSSWRPGLAAAIIFVRTVLVAVDLKFLHHLPQARSGTSNR
jgi:hypothetical protein